MTQGWEGVEEYGFVRVKRGNGGQVHVQKSTLLFIISYYKAYSLLSISPQYKNFIINFANYCLKQSHFHIISFSFGNSFFWPLWHIPLFGITIIIRLYLGNGIYRSWGLQWFIGSVWQKDDTFWWSSVRIQVVVSVSLGLCGVYVGVVMATLSPIPSRLKMYYKRTRVTSTN